MAERHASRPQRPAESDGTEWTPGWPVAVRLMAVAYVLSWPIGFVGFLLLVGAAGYRFANGAGFDLLTQELLACGLACPAACAVYRTWFPRWGARRWPDGKPNSGDDRE